MHALRGMLEAQYLLQQSGPDHAPNVELHCPRSLQVCCLTAWWSVTIAFTVCRQSQQNLLQQYTARDSAVAVQHEFMQIAAS